MNVRLTYHERKMAWIVGAWRHESAESSGRKNKHGADPEKSLRNHALGAAGEMVVAKAIGVYWIPSVNTFKLPDVGAVQVRCRSGDSDKHELIVRDDDSPDEVFVLVASRGDGEFRVRGWIKGVDARVRDWRKAHGGREEAWFVPHANLHPMSLLSGMTPQPR